MGRRHRCRFPRHAATAVVAAIATNGGTADAGGDRRGDGEEDENSGSEIFYCYSIVRVK